MNYSAFPTESSLNPLDSLFEAVCSSTRKAAVLSSVEAMLEWDERTIMPKNAASYRSEQVAEIAGLVHAKRTDPARGEQLASLVASQKETGGSPQVQAAIRLMARDLKSSLVYRVAW